MKHITNIGQALRSLADAQRRQQTMQRFPELTAEYIKAHGAEPSDDRLAMWRINAQGPMLDINALDPIDPVHRHGTRDLDREEADNDDDATEVNVTQSSVEWT